MEHHAPHPTAAFEGWYSKFDLPSGGHVALILCSIPSATTLPPHMVSFTYYPPSPSSSTPIFQREHWVKDIQRVITGPNHAFELRVEGMGTMSVSADATTQWDLKCEDWEFKGATKGAERVPWMRNKSTPEGWLIHLPLPLHWHVHSLGSLSATELTIPSIGVKERGTSIVHLEKNWANSFPEAHMWIQARSPTSSSGICLAGGKILGMTAFLIGYASPDLNIDFVPPFALSIFGLSPFMSFNVDWENRTFNLTVQSFWKKLVLRAKAPKESGWFGLASPFIEGHRKNFVIESFRATIEVEIWERGWLGGWSDIKSDTFEGGSLEFGGGYYPERGEKRE
ncbi:hypothetical protein P154DRAFT_123152 [Amniculicola lignicola CBS 123094]|uniref:Uncharacterized protein n=1 Tax=Amniculicola lignicola CBS 123094 TaxID=1392246 RepID=A0A6A5WM79_9PLEO|nr:hypothetical protein P154DRAFT_123152 [Amniculicola lignicola CBS 123094]